MLSEIISEITKLEKSNFTGHVKFGVERGDISSISLTTKTEKTSYRVKEYIKTLNEICKDSDDYFGSVEADFDFGLLIHIDWTRVYNGPGLEKRLKENIPCRSAKVVVKKSNS